MWLFGSSNQSRVGEAAKPTPNTTTSTAVSFSSPFPPPSSSSSSNIASNTVSSSPTTNTLAESVSVGWELLMDKSLDKQEQLKRLAGELETSSFSLPEDSEKTLGSLLLISCKTPTLLESAKECLRKAIPKLSNKGIQSFCEQFCNDYADTNQLEAIVTLLDALPPLEGLHDDEKKFSQVSTATDSIITTLFGRVTSTNISAIIQLIGKLFTKYASVNRLPNLKKIQIYKDYLSTGILLGQGSFAKVYLSFHKKTAEKFAIKVMNYQRLFQRNSATAVQVKNEIDVMTETTHPNIVRLVDKFMIGDHVYLILEYCDGGSLDALIKKTGPLGEERAKKIMQELAEAFRFLRSKDYVHRDMKPANILLATDPATKQWTVKITDFTFARIMELGDTADTFCGTPLYMAPEILARGPYTDKADLWSLGVIMYEMLTGKRPFETHKLIASSTRAEELTLEFPSDVQLSTDAKSLLQAFLQADPNKRISWAEFFWHPFVKPPKTKSMGSSISPSVSTSLEHLQLRAEAAEKKALELQQKLQEAEARFQEMEKNRQQELSELSSAKEQLSGNVKELEVRLSKETERSQSIQTEAESKHQQLTQEHLAKETLWKQKEITYKQQLESLNSNTDDRLKEAKARETDLEQKVTELEEELQAQANEREITKKELADLKAELQNTTHRLTHSEEEANTTAKTLAQKTVEVLCLKEELEALSATKGELVLSLQSQIEDLKNQKKTLEARNSNLSEELNKEKKTVLERENSLKSKEEEVATLKSKLEAAESKNNDLNALVNGCRSDLEKVTRSSESITQKLKETQEALEKRESLLITVTQNRNQLTEQLVQRDNNIKTLTKEKEELGQSLSDVKRQLEVANTTLKAERDRLSASTAMLVQSNVELGQLKVYQDQANKLTEELKSKEAQLTEVRATLANARTEIQSLRELRQDSDIRFQEFQMLLDSNEHEIRSTKERMEDLMARVAELEQIKKEQTKEIEGLTKETKALSKELEAMTVECVMLQNELATYKLLLKETNELNESTIIPFDIQGRGGASPSVSRRP